MAIQGSCLCGTLRYEIEGPIDSLTNCHCSRCRKMHGAPFATYAAISPEALRWISGRDNVVSHAVAPGSARHFCRTCGSIAPFALPEHGIAFAPAGNLEGDIGIRPQAHLFVGSKAVWYEISDQLAQHAANPPELGDAPVLPDDPRPASDGRIHGSCLCGEVAYALVNPIAMFQCHCNRCRKARSAAHGANLFCKVADFEWLRGEERITDYKLPEAKFYAVAFCGQCGASVPRVSKERGIVVVPVPGLDTDPGLRPMAHIFAGSKAPWFEITDELQQYAEGPPSFVPQPPR
jgi:hypothetical protein